MSIADREQEGAGWGILDGLPGDPMMWVIVFSELVAFGLSSVHSSSRARSI